MNSFASFEITLACMLDIMYSKWVTAPKRGSEIKNKNNNKINENRYHQLLRKSHSDLQDKHRTYTSLSLLGSCINI